jgi:hypothetical protein
MPSHLLAVDNWIKRLPGPGVVVLGTASAPLSGALDVTPCGYFRHPFGTAHAKIIFLMKTIAIP